MSESSTDETRQLRESVDIFELLYSELLFKVDTIQTVIFYDSA